MDVLIIGAGDQKDVDIVRKQIGHTITQQRIGYEIMGTVSGRQLGGMEKGFPSTFQEEAVATFNFLNAEHRYFALPSLSLSSIQNNNKTSPGTQLRHCFPLVR